MVELFDVAVRLSPAGSPIAVRAAGEDFVVIARPQLWMDRAPWWDRANGEVLTAGDLERERWSVPSITATGRKVVIELRHDRTAGRWDLVSVS